LAYNAALFEANGWKVPETYEELAALADTIAAANVPSRNSPGTAVRPFVWSGTSEYLWDTVVFDWWAQLAGVGINEQNPNSISSFNQYLSHRQFDPNEAPELKEAWTAWYDLIAASPQNVMPHATGMDHLDSQRAFAMGHAAMMPAASWLRNEIGADILEHFGADIRLMPTPLMPNAKGNFNYAIEARDSMVLAARSPNIEIGEEFFRFMAETEISRIFPEKAGGALFAHKYDFNGLIRDADSEWDKSMYEIMQRSVRFSTWSENPMAILGHVSPFPNTHGYVRAANQPNVWTPDAYFADRHELVTRNWTTWLRQSGLRG
jgi:hypothetical protein